MNNLKDDFIKRFSSSEDRFVFSSLMGRSYTTRECEYYFFYIYQKIRNKKSKIALLCDSSVESHILSFFLILSPEIFFLISKDCEKKQFNELIHNQNIKTIIKFENNKDKYDFQNQIQIINASSIENFVKDTHPSFSKDKINVNYYNIKSIGKTIFLSSGSTGKPKLIPLKFDQINSCYHNVKKGFLEDIPYQRIISLHDTSFVIILPFLFSFASNKKSNLVSSDIKFNLTPLLQLFKNIEKLSEAKFLMISVPSIYRMLTKLLKEKSYKLFNNQNLITCGEPLDRKLAYEINDFNPFKFLNLYGSTEVSPWIIFLDILQFLKNNPDDKNPILPAGIPLPNVRLLISSTNELLVNSDSIFDGYLNLNNKDTFKEANSRIYFNTGDNFELKNNLYYCKGRKNNSIKIGGVFLNAMILESKIKDVLNIDHILIIPNQLNSSIYIFIFEKYIQNFNLIGLNKKIKDIVYDFLAAKITIKFIKDVNNIVFLHSGKIDRKFYTDKIKDD